MVPLSKILGLTIVALVALTACALGPKENSAPHTYFLNPEIASHNPQVSAKRIGGSVLLISQPKAQGGFDTARMAYLLRPYEVSYYAFNQWADTPARLLHRIMVESLDNSGLWSAVLQSPGAVPAQYRLDTDNLILEQQFFSRPSRVRLALRAQIVDTKKLSILATRYFELFEVAPSDDAYGGVQAANHAAATLLTDLVAWLDDVFKVTR